MIRTGLGLRARLIRAPWALAAVVLPRPLLYELWHYRQRGQRRPDLATATDQRILRPQPGVVLEIYWSEVEGVGRGPSASLFVMDEEVLRLDCFGGDDGHMHVNPVQSRLISTVHIPRLRFPPGPIPAHIERAAFELERNAEAAKSSNLLGRVRAFALDGAALGRAARDMAAIMIDMTNAHGRAGGAS